MARPLRVSFPGAVYHVTARGNERRPIVADDEDRQRFVRTLAGMIEEHEVICHAWVLMTNHYHLVVETPRANVSQAIHYLNGQYSQAYNRRHERVGHLFQGRFSGILVDKESYLLEVCRYVVLNPVRAELVDSPEDWPWSSFRATAGLAPCPPWLTTDWLLGHFGTRRATATEAYQRFVAEGLARDRSLWSEMRGRAVLGSQAFVSEIRARVAAVEDPDLLSPVAEPWPETPSMDEVLAGVAAAYRLPVAELMEPRTPYREARRVAIFLARRVARRGLAEVAARFGAGKAAVSKVARAIGSRVRVEPALRGRVEASLGKWKDLTPWKMERPDPMENGKT
ncbi:MAG TPA: transposase [Thermodesulfobacteriota bacterium]